MAKKLYLNKPSAGYSHYSTSRYFDIRRASSDGHRFHLPNDYWCSAYYYDAKLFEIGASYWINGVDYCKCIEKTGTELVMEVIIT